MAATEPTPKSARPCRRVRFMGSLPSQQLLTFNYLSAYVPCDESGVLPGASLRSPEPTKAGESSVLSILSGSSSLVRVPETPAALSGHGAGAASSRPITHRRHMSAGSKGRRFRCFGH